VALAGVVVNDYILLVNFIKHYHCNTKSIADVAPKASQAHFGAVFSTSATTIVGLMPMLSETNLQAQILIPLVTSRCFGLLVSTVLVYFWCLLHMLSLTIWDGQSSIKSTFTSCCYDGRCL
jgi:HAE1 family hydrophobic/amphiphilic exporter-1